MVNLILGNSGIWWYLYGRIKTYIYKRSDLMYMQGSFIAIIVLIHQDLIHIPTKIHHMVNWQANMHELKIARKIENRANT